MKPALISLLAALALCVGAAPAQAGWWRAMHLDTHPGYDPGHSFLRDAVRGDDSSNSSYGDGNWGDGNSSVGDGHSETWAEVRADSAHLARQEDREEHHYLAEWAHQEAHRRRSERCSALHAVYETRHPLGRPDSLRFHSGCSLWEADARYHDSDPFDSGLMSVL